jgi:steroid 5-alpha reductase family enzyme
MTEFPWAAVGLNLLVSIVAVAALMAIVMGVSIRAKDHSLIDIFWGPAFVLVAVVSYLLSAGSAGDSTRRLVVLVLTAVWGLRLGLHIGRRNRGHGEDPRYTALMRHQTGSLVGYLVRKVYGLQGLLVVVVSLPVQVAMYESTPLGLLGGLGIVVWLVGFVFEAVGDQQLARFKADPANEGRIMDRGLWAWTRHPNYFGDSCVWAGLFLLALGSPVGLLTVVSPIVMTLLLVSYSGKALLEKGMRRKRGAAYDDYIERTSGFFPRPPRRPARTDGAS